MNETDRNALVQEMIEMAQAALVHYTQNPSEVEDMGVDTPEEAAIAYIYEELSERLAADTMFEDEERDAIMAEIEEALDL